MSGFHSHIGNYWLRSVPCLVATASCLLGGSRGVALAAPWAKISARLPEFMADFEVNRDTGDVAAVSPMTNMAYLFRYDDVVAATAGAASDNVTLMPSEEVSVCSTPYSIRYKVYKDWNGGAIHRYYGIVCTQVDEILIFDAANFSFVAEVKIGGLGASGIISSRNPRDPFFYYNYESGHDSTLAALDVRSMEDRGNVVPYPRDSSMDAAISADGRIIYTRGPWSPSGLQSIELTNDAIWNQTGSTPTFTQVFYDHKSTGEYIPDTKSEKTASGKVIYSKTLESELAAVDFEVKCWGADSSYLFGFATEGNSYWDKRVSGIAIASSNTYQLISKEPAILPDDFFVKEEFLPEIPRGVGGSADFKRMSFQRKLLADDLHSELIAAFANRLSILAYRCFEVGSVSFAPNATDFFIGIGSQSIQIDESGKHNIFENDEISIISGLPEGATFDPRARVMTWEPTGDQLGAHELLILAGGCHFDITLHVLHQSMKLPFNPNDILIVDETDGLLVLWSSHGSSYHDYNNDLCPEHSKRCLSIMSLVRVHGHPQLVSTKYFDFQIERIFATRERIVVVRTQDSGTRSQAFQVFDSGVLVQPLATFMVDRNVYSSSSFMSIDPKSFQIKDKNKLKTVDLQTFEIVEHDLLHGSSIPSSHASDGTSFSSSETGLIREGLIKNGILYNPTSGLPLAILDKGPFSLNDDSLYNSYYSHLPSWLLQIPKYVQDYSSQNEMVALYEAGLCLQPQVLETQHGQNNNRWKEVVIHVLDLEGNFLGSKKVIEEPWNHNDQTRSALAAGRENVFLAHSSMVYSFKSSDFDFSGNDSVMISVPRASFHFAPNQTTFCARGDGDIELSHTLLGGIAPFNFFDTNSRVSGLQLNATTGRITLNATKFRIEARDVLVKHFTTSDSDDPFELLAASRKASEPLMHLESCGNPSDLPVSKEVSMQVVDQHGDRASIVYYVFIGIPYEEVAPFVEARYQSTTAPSSTTVPYPQCNCSCPVCESSADVVELVSLLPSIYENGTAVTNETPLISDDGMQVNKSLVTLSPSIYENDTAVKNETPLISGDDTEVNKSLMINGSKENQTLQSDDSRRNSQGCAVYHSKISGYLLLTTILGFFV